MAPDLAGRPTRLGEVFFGHVEEPAAGHAEADRTAVDQLVLRLRGDRDVAARAGVVLDEGHGVGAVALDEASILLADVFRDDVLGPDDGGLELGELRPLLLGLRLDLVPEGLDLL